MPAAPSARSAVSGGAVEARLYLLDICFYKIDTWRATAGWPASGTICSSGSSGRRAIAAASAARRRRASWSPPDRRRGRPHDAVRSVERAGCRWAGWARRRRGARALRSGAHPRRLRGRHRRRRRRPGPGARLRRVGSFLGRGEITMPRLLVIDDRDQTVEMVHRQMPQFETVTRCDRRIPCQVCEERTRGCGLRCAHDYAEAAEALGRQSALPDLVVLDLHFALPEERLLPEDKSALPTDAKARRAALEQLRRRQGLLILEKLRATLSDAAGGHADDHRLRPRRRAAGRSARLSVRERGGRQPQPGRRDLAGAGAVAQRAGGADLLGARPGHDRVAAADRDAGAITAAAAGRGGDRDRQELPGRARDPPALGRQGAAGGDRSVDGAARAAGGAPLRSAAGRLHGRRRGSRRRVRAGARRDAVPRRDRQPGSRSAAAALAGAGAWRGHAAR